MIVIVVVVAFFVVVSMDLCMPSLILPNPTKEHTQNSLSLSLSVFTWVLALEPSPRLTHISRPKTMDSCINSLNTYLTISTHHHHHYYQLSTLKVFIFHISFYILKLFFFIQNFFIYFF